MKEAAFFRKLYNDSIVSCVIGDGMESYYSVGDYVGGIISKNIKDAVNKNCIITTQEEEQLIRKLIKGSKSGLYTLVCVNPFTKETPPILFDQSIKTAAPIIWHRRRYY